MKYINEENDGDFVDVDAIVAQIDYESDREDEELGSQEPIIRTLSGKHKHIRKVVY